MSHWQEMDEALKVEGWVAAVKPLVDLFKEYGPTLNAMAADD